MRPFPSDKGKLFLAIVIMLGHFLWPPHGNFYTFPDFVNASPTRNRPVHKPQRECNISTTSRIGYGGAILFISHRVTRIKIITADCQVVTSAS